MAFLPSNKLNKVFKDEIGFINSNNKDNDRWDKELENNNCKYNKWWDYKTSVNSKFCDKKIKE